MFASLKSKIKEETGSDISKLASGWRAGNFLGRISMKDESTTTTTPSSSGGPDSTSESISPQLESYLSDRTSGGQIDQMTLQGQYTTQLEEKLKERDTFWERKLEELKLESLQGGEAAASQAVARAAQAEAAAARAQRDEVVTALTHLKDRVAQAEAAHHRLDALTEELEQSRRDWAREKSELSAALSLAEARAKDLTDELELVRAALPPDSKHHAMNDDDKREVKQTESEDFAKVCRERAVLSRQLQEAKMALADVKTSWSGQIASLETQVARLSRQAGEEGGERRRVETQNRDLAQQILQLNAQLEKTKQSLANSDAKEKTMEIQRKLDEEIKTNAELKSSLENEKTLVKILHEKLEKSSRLYDEKRAEVTHLNGVVADLQLECRQLERQIDKEKREKDEALLRNATMSQSIEMSKCEVRYQEAEVAELKGKVTKLEGLLAQHKENQAACMLIKEGEAARLSELQALRERLAALELTENTLKDTLQQLETELCDKNKKIKTLDNRIADMKKTLQRELQTSKTDLTTAEEQDISRRYLKHVVLRFVTGREVEARQLTRALSALLSLSPHEEAQLRDATRSHWIHSLGT